MPFPPTLKDFGHGSLTVGGRPAAGGRPLLVVIADWAEHAPIEDTHGVDYYDRLGFGDPVPPLSTANPVNPASMREYFRENSYGRFWFDRVAVVGPLHMGALGADPGAYQRVTAIMAKVVQAAPQAIATADANADRKIETQELAVLLVESFPDAQPANTPHAPVSFSFPLPLAPPYTVAVTVAGGGPVTPFYQLAHELSHIALVSCANSSLVKL